MGGEGRVGRGLNADLRAIPKGADQNNVKQNQSATPAIQKERPRPKQRKPMHRHPDEAPNSHALRATSCSEHRKKGAGRVSFRSATLRAIKLPLRPTEGVQEVLILDVF